MPTKCGMRLFPSDSRVGICIARHRHENGPNKDAVVSNKDSNILVLVQRTMHLKQNFDHWFDLDLVDDGQFPAHLTFCTNTDDS